MTRFKKAFAALIAVITVIGILPIGTAAQTKDTDKPLITIGAISDPHVDYNLQKNKPYIRPAFITAVDALKNEGIDLLLVGGDMTSDNQDNGGNLRWKPEVYARTLEQYRVYSSAASSTGMTLWACGNHDFEVGAYSDSWSLGDYNSYQGFIDMMLATCGDPIDLFTQGDNPDYKSSTYEDHWLGAHYNIKGFDFVIINANYNAWQEYSVGTLTWLDETLNGIGADKTVFVLGHYPLADNRGVTNPTSYGIKDEAYDNFVKVMNKYDNAVYLYGHNHGRANDIEPYISSDVFERITHYDESGLPVDDRNAAPTSFVTAFMGSAGYYGSSLSADDPDIIQAMTISVYTDRIEFKMINCGKNEGASREPEIWTLKREVISSGEREEVGAPILVTEEENSDVYYGSALGITKYEMPKKVNALSNGYHKIEAEEIEKFDFTVKRQYYGAKYDKYMKKLSSVVSDAVIFEYNLKKGSRYVVVDTPVKITLPALINEFGKKTAELDLAAYYWDTEDKLCMTDITVNEDGSYSFIMTNLSAFAISERANAKDQLPKLKTEKDSGGFDPAVIIIAVSAAMIVAVAAVTVIIIMKKNKKAAVQSGGEVTPESEEK